MKKYITICTLFLATISFSQSFSIPLDEQISNDLAWNLFELEDGFLIVSMSTVNNTLPGSLAFFKTDFEGNLLWNKFHDSLNISTDKIIDHGSFLICNGRNIKDTINPTRLLKFDLEGNLVFEKAFGETFDGETSLNIGKTDDTYVLNHRINIDGVKHGWHQFLDIDFNLTTEVLFPENESYDLVSSAELIATHDNNFIGGSLIYFGLDEGFIPLVTKFDEEGEVLWSNSLDIKSFYTGLEVIELNNHNLIVNWYSDTTATDFFFGYPAHPPAIYCLDASGSTLWNYEFELSEEINESLEIFRIRPLANGDFMGMGYARYHVFDAGELDDCGWIFRMTSEGELLWQRRICQADRPISDKFFYSGRELSNGDLLFGGLISGYSELLPIGIVNNIWLTRVDANGCLAPDCSEVQILTDVKKIPLQESNFTVFPMPVSNNLNIQWNGTQAISGQVMINLFDAFGKQLHTSVYPNLLPKEIISLGFKNHYQWDLLHKDTKCLWSYSN